MIVLKKFDLRIGRQYVSSVNAMTRDEAIRKLNPPENGRVVLAPWPKHWTRRPSFTRAVVESGSYGW